LVVHVRDDKGSEFSARSGADPQSKSVTLGAGALPPPNRQEGKMNAHNDVKRPSDQSVDARLVLAAAQLRFAALVDFLVARWLERCATNAEVARWWQDRSEVWDSEVAGLSQRPSGCIFCGLIPPIWHRAVLAHTLTQIAL
jgi:hypothetical protein